MSNSVVMSEEDNKLKQYKELDKQLSKLCKGTYSGFGTRTIETSVDFIPTLSSGFDKTFGGIAPGRIYEIYGPEGSSKSTLALFLTKSMQAQGKVCAWLDVEATFTDEYGHKCGVDIEELMFMRPDTMNEAMEVTRAMAKSNLVDFIVIDSVAALTPSDDFDREAGSSVIATKARMFSQMLPQLTALCKSSGCTLLFINQQRAANLGGYGPKTTTTGGSALRYACSVRIEMASTGVIDSKGEVVGMKIRAKAKKNKVWYPFGVYEFQIRTMNQDTDFCGLDLEHDLYSSAVSLGLVTRSGAWYNFGEHKVQGEENFVSKIRNEPEFKQLIQEAIDNASQEKNSTERHDSISTEGEEE